MISIGPRNTTADVIYSKPRKTRYERYQQPITYDCKALTPCVGVEWRKRVTMRSQNELHMHEVVSSMHIEIAFFSITRAAKKILANEKFRGRWGVGQSNLYML